AISNASGVRNDGNSSGRATDVSAGRDARHRAPRSTAKSMRGSSNTRPFRGRQVSLPWRERLALLAPPSRFYRRLIAQEARTGEPELAVLAKLAPRGGTAVDVGANRGVFADALAAVADRVVAFEPNPDYALFARLDAAR